MISLKRKTWSLPYRPIETLGDPYYRRVPLPRIPEYRDLSRESQLTKQAVEIAGVEPNSLNGYPNGCQSYPNGYQKIFGRRRSTRTMTDHSVVAWLPCARYRHNIYLAPCNKHLLRLRLNSLNNVRGRPLPLIPKYRPQDPHASYVLYLHV